MSRLLAVTGRLLAVTGRLLAIGRCVHSALSRRGAVSFATPAILSCAQRHLSPVTRRSGIFPRLRAITQRGGLIADQCRQIARTRGLIASIARIDTGVGAVLALLGASSANLTRGVMRFRVAAVREVAVAGGLIAIGSCLLSIGRTLVAVRPRLVGIREALITINERLIVLEDLRNRGDCWYLVALHDRFLALAAPLLLSLSTGPRWT
jgi:hypothetical protein